MRVGLQRKTRISLRSFGLRTLLWVVAFILPAAAQNAHFGGFDCFRDCASHAAGYRWAEREGVTRVGECRGLSLQVLEGCRAYVNDPRRGADHDDEGRPIVERPRWPRRMPER